MAEPTIGIALSGGGSRAIAFHLGCLRALHDQGILDQVKILSTVSGGSVIGALYTLTDGLFQNSRTASGQFSSAVLYGPHFALHF